ncbi:hypothetical protein Pyn_24845 [Prunus yedoensis var. nudiflora]|uniref:Uncharacterized protein n=1 Tax=Prunus yedoensis var. nudiflora TaxID=2094558 RepID=A0A314YGQ9_PRUYE|nr:hypothetical protein Pyn_24845 [Prunus yedoensis var. nudiflora]
MRKREMGMQDLRLQFFPKSIHYLLPREVLGLNISHLSTVTDGSRAFVHRRISLTWSTKGAPWGRYLIPELADIYSLAPGDTTTTTFTSQWGNCVLLQLLQLRLAKLVELLVLGEIPPEFSDYQLQVPGRECKGLNFAYRLDISGRDG